MEIDNKNIGLVLSGGGSKGLAHAGVLKFLEEINIFPSVISGSSAGAIVGALYAAGKKPEEILEFFKSIYFFNWKHFTFKKPGLINTESFKSYFKHQLRDLTLSELNIPIYVTATDLISGKLKIFSSETLAVDAVLASSSFPGMLSPYIIDGMLFSDGGILNHFPTELLQGRCNKIIGVYLSPVQDIEAKDLKSIKSVTMRAFELLTANNNQPKFSSCDWLIEPLDLIKYSTFETNQHKMDEIFEIGYLCAKTSYQNYLSSITN